jgi:calpain-15
MDANYRDIPILESENLSHLQLQYTPFRVGDFSHDMEESFVDPYVRPRTPMDYHKTPSPPELLEPQGANQQDAAAKSHGEKETEESRALLEASVAGGHWNRTKCVEERREEDVLCANVVYQEILRYSRTSGEPFTDPDFPPADKSLYSDPSQPVARWQVGKWERPSETRDDFDSQGIEWTVLREARPEDIAQGVLGNCWVLSALGVIAEQPQLIEDILITKQYCPELGAYQVRLCRDGRWEVVVVDDCFPCLNTGELVFSKAHRKQLWVPLIEKALAKLYGSYEALNAGRVLLGLSVLTGLPCEKIHVKRPSAKGDEVDTDLIWARLLSFRERGFPMSAACGGEGGEEEESTYALLGLESNHAYSILDVRQIGSDQLIRLRNPWGKYSWKGSWSDTDSRWESRPWMRDELRAVGGDAGVFWMAASDFFQYFCEVDVCKYRPNWHSLRSEGMLLPFAAPQVETLAFQVDTTTEVDISIYQPSSRYV